MKIYAISDTHFNHENLIKWGHRSQGFEDKILKNISNVKGDILIHCGDFAIGRDEYWHEAFMKAASGFKRKILVRGNHDNKSNAWYYDHGWDFVCEAYLVKLFGKNVLFSHIPVVREDKYWSPHFPPVMNIHGHLHGNMHREGAWFKPEYKGYFYDLAPEVNDHKPVDVEIIISQNPL